MRFAPLLICTVLTGLPAGAVPSAIAAASAAGAMPATNRVAELRVSAEGELRALEAGLRATKAVGTFTKLALANDVKRIQQDARALLGGRSGGSLEGLRGRYDALVNKTLLLIQDKDPELARQLAQMREPLWQALTGPGRGAAA